MIGKIFSRRRRAHRFFKPLLVPVAVVVFSALLVWTIGLFRYAEAIPDRVDEPNRITDAIIVLTGGSGRLDAGLKLLAENRAKKLFVSGVYKGVDVDKLLEMSRRSPEELNCCVEIGHSADNTAGNAVETANWARRQGIRSLRLVTSGYHMPRSLLEFRYAMPDMELVPHPVFADNVKQRQWWAWPGTTGLIIGEYNKFLLARVRHLTGRLFGNGSTPP